MGYAVVMEEIQRKHLMLSQQVLIIEKCYYLLVVFLIVEGIEN